MTYATREEHHAALVRQMVGMTFSRVRISADKEMMLFEAPGGGDVVFLHYRDCCESVEITEHDGDLEWLVGAPITVAEVVSNEYEREPDYGPDERWVFYRFATTKGEVTVRWHGSSNGYYCTDVDVEMAEPGERLDDEVYHEFEHGRDRTP